MLFNKVATVVLLALASKVSSMTLDRRASQVVGIRHMGQAEAQSVNAAKALVWDSNVGNQGGQLGVGVYATTNPFAWSYENWHAKLTANPTTPWNNVKKAWIPQFANVNGATTYIWGNEQLISAYLTSLGLDPARTVRMQGVEDYIQFLLPPALVTGNPLKIKAEAVQGLETFSMVWVDWASWSNIMNPGDKAGAMS